MYVGKFSFWGTCNTCVGILITPQCDRKQAEKAHENGIEKHSSENVIEKVSHILLSTMP